MEVEPAPKPLPKPVSSRGQAVWFEVYKGPGKQWVKSLQPVPVEAGEDTVVYVNPEVELKGEEEWDRTKSESFRLNVAESPRKCLWDPDKKVIREATEEELASRRADVLPVEAKVERVRRKARVEATARDFYRGLARLTGKTLEQVEDAMKRGIDDTLDDELISESEDV